MEKNYDIVLKNGFLIDPVNHFEGVRDIGICGEKICAVQENIPDTMAEQVFDLKGLYVMPGIVDLHSHESEWLGGRCGHKMMALAGVTTALDMSGPIDGVLKIAREYGAGLTLAAIDRLTPGYNISNNAPDKSELEAALESSLGKGCIGIKIMGGNYPMTPESTANAIEVANESKAYVAYHSGTTETGSHLGGLLETAELIGDNHLHLAHINSYCRGMKKSVAEEIQSAIDLLCKNERICSEAYLSLYNGNNGKCIDGVPEASVIRNCLKMGGYSQNQAGYEQAILDGWANIHVIRGGETLLMTGTEAVEYWREHKTDTGVSFPVNPALTRFWLASAKREDGTFAVDTISTDGGGIPRNVILSNGLSLVKLGALTLREFVIKASVNPGLILGMTDRGHLGVGATADITVFNFEKQSPYMSLGMGKLIMYRGYICGRGTNMLTTKAGSRHVLETGLNPVLTDISKGAFYDRNIIKRVAYGIG